MDPADTNCLVAARGKNLFVRSFTFDQPSENISAALNQLETQAGKVYFAQVHCAGPNWCGGKMQGSKALPSESPTSPTTHVHQPKDNHNARAHFENRVATVVDHKFIIDLFA